MSTKSRWKGESQVRDALQRRDQPEMREFKHGQTVGPRTTDR